MPGRILFIDPSFSVEAWAAGLPVLVLCVGDSLTRGYPDANNNYPAVLQASLGNGYVVQNLGVSGQPISRALNLNQSILGSLSGQIAAINRANYSQVLAIVDGGANDYRIFGESYPGNDVVGLTFAARRAAHQLLAAANIKTIALTHSNYAYDGSNGGYTGSAPPNFAAAIKASMAQEDTRTKALWATQLQAQGLVDLAADAKIGTATPDASYFSDGLHFTTLGNQRKAAAILPAVQALAAGATYGTVTPLPVTNSLVIDDASGLLTYGPNWYDDNAATTGSTAAFVHSEGTARVALNANDNLNATLVIPKNCAEIEVWFFKYTAPLSTSFYLAGGSVTTIATAAGGSNQPAQNRGIIPGPFTAGQVLHITTTPGANAQVIADKFVLNTVAAGTPIVP